MTRTLFWDRKKSKRARCLEWDTKRSQKHRHKWHGEFWTKDIFPYFSFDKFKFGEPEFVFITEKRQNHRKRNPFGINKCGKGSVVHHSASHMDFS